MWLKFNTKASGTDTQRMYQSDGKVKMGTDTTTSARGFLDVKEMVIIKDFM